MTVEFLWDCCTIAFVADGLDESLKERFPCTGFHWTHDSITTIEQEHCHPYQPLATIAFIFTLIDYITNPKASWPVDSDTVVAYSQVQRFHDTWRELCINHAIQAQTRTAFGRSCRSSEWSYSSGHQSTVATAITSRTILDWTSHSLLVCPPRIVAVATWVYSTKMLHRLRNPHAYWDKQYSDEEVHASTHHESYVPWFYSRARHAYVVTITCPFRAMSRVFGDLMVSALLSGFEPWPGTLRCVFRPDTLLLQCLSPPRYINGTGEFHAGVTLRWTSISSKGSRNTSSRFVPDGPLGSYADYTLQPCVLQTVRVRLRVVKRCVARRASAVIITCPFRAMSRIKPAQYSSS